MNKQWLIDLVGLAGVGVFTYGAWLVYQPAAFLVAGALLMAWALLKSMASNKGGAQ